jgi:hypothetical protein
MGSPQRRSPSGKKRAFANDAPMGPKEVRSTVLTSVEEAAVVAFRKYTLLPLDDCLNALQPSPPHLTRSSCIAACNGTASAGCRRSKAIKRRNRSSLTRLATSTSTLPRCKRKMASCICSWPWIAPQSSPMPSFILAPHGSSPKTFSII